MENKIIDFKIEYKDLLFELIISTIKEIYSSKYNEEIIKYFLSYNKPEHILTDSEEGYTALFFRDKKLVGSGCLVGTNIRRMFVLPEYQRIGLGTEIMRHLEQKARIKNQKFVELYSMTFSEDFYKKMGYTGLNVSNWKVDKSNTVNYIRMAKKLLIETESNDYHLNNKTFKIKNSMFPFLIGQEILFTQKNELVRATFPKREKLNEELIGLISGKSLFLNYSFVNENKNYTGQITAYLPKIAGIKELILC